MPILSERNAHAPFVKGRQVQRLCRIGMLGQREENGPGIGEKWENLQKVYNKQKMRYNN